MKKDTFYFQHDYNASTDVKCLFLRQALGMEGYGIYWFLIEQLANSGGFLPLSITPVLAMQMQVTEIKVQSVICNFNLFTIDIENNFFSRRLNEHLEIRKSLSDSGKRGALNRWNKKENSHPISHPISDGNNHPNAKEIKEKEIKIIYTYSKFYDEQIELSQNDKYYLLFVKWLFGDNIFKRPLEKVLNMKEQVSWKQFPSLLEIHNETGVKIRTLLEELENWLMKNPKAKNATVLGTLRTFANRAKTEKK